MSGADATFLAEKARMVFEKTLRIHKACPETRLASSLSCIEILVALHYGGVLRFDPKNPLAESRDRFIISKGHGSISFYPILADLGFIDERELFAPCTLESKLKAIPDTLIEGYETTNGSLGHGLGVGAGMALGLALKGSDSRVFVLSGDGELLEGSVWEAVMFAGHHRLSNLFLVVDRNKLCMLGHCEEIVALDPLTAKFEAFGWRAVQTDGHDAAGLARVLRSVREETQDGPVAVVADTVKGRGVERLERDPLCHIRSLGAEEVDRILAARGGKP